MKFVNLDNNGKIYKIHVIPFKDANDVRYAVYRKDFSAVGFNVSSVYGGIERPNRIVFNHIYDTSNCTDCDVSQPNGGGDIYYGKYTITFKEYTAQNEFIQDLASAIIDFRDCDYGYPSGETDAYEGVGVGNPQDFFITYDYSTGVVTYKYGGDEDITESGTGIWNFLSEVSGTIKPQNTSLFKNFSLSTQGFSGSPTYQLAINGAPFNFQGNGVQYTGVGFDNPTSVLIAAPNRIPHPTPSTGLSFFLSEWNGATTYDSSFSFPFNGNVVAASTVKYVQTAQDIAPLAGPLAFGSSSPVTYLAAPLLILNRNFCRWTWFVKDDATGIWQQSGPSDATSEWITVSPTYSPEHGFSLKCWMKDTSLKMGVWSNTIHVAYAPPLVATIEGPTSCIPQFSTATWYTEPEGGDGNYVYEWKKGTQVVSTGPTVSLQVSGGFTLNLKVCSTYGTQIVNKSVNVSTSCGGGGCPFVFSHTESGLVKDNNILHRSEFPENVAKNIVDLYKLTAKPMLDGDRYKLTVQELNEDHSYFDGFRLYAIDHPEDTRIAITQGNDIVLYSPSLVISPESSHLYGLDMTGYMGYSRNYGIVGLKSDTLSLDFPSISETYNVLNSMRSSNRKDSLALLATMGHPQTNLLPKEMAASVETASGSFTLANRQSESEEVLPLSELPTKLSIIWNQDYTIRSVGVTRVFYDGFTKTDLPLIEAAHSLKGDSKKSLNRIDGKFAELEKNQTMVLSFKNQKDIPSGWVRDFILETNGYYTTPHQVATLRKDAPDNSVLTAPTKFGLVGNYPNPFNPSTSLVFNLASRSRVQIDIYNILGQKVRSLHDGVLSEGRNTLIWDGKNDDDNLVPSGTYIWQLQTAEFVASKKMVLIK